MKKALLSLLVAASMTVVTHAQEVGDSEQAVIKALGKPPMARTSGDRQIWIYSNGTKIVLKGGVVVEAKVAIAPAPLPAAEMVAPAPTPRVTPPQASAPRVLAPVARVPRTSPGKSFFRHRSGFGLVLAIVAYILMFVCGIMILVQAFRTSALWGIAVLIIPFAQIIFVVTHWADTKKPFLLTWLVGVPLLVISVAIG